MNYLGLTSLVVLIRLALCDIFAFSKFSNQTIEEFRDEPAQFGAQLPSTGIKVEAVEAYPSEGCSSIYPPPDRPTISKWVVIIARNNCTFEEKVRNAQRAGYDAVIVYNKGSNELEPMSAKNAFDIHIPSVFVGEMTGRTIINNYLYAANAYLVLTGEPFNNTNLILAFSILAGLCFILMIIFMIVKHVREQRRLRRHRLPSKLLKKIPTIKFTKAEPYETCVICLDDFVEGDKLRVLPCSHAYHCLCIDTWLTKSRRVCPICKRRVFAQGEKRRRTSSDSMSETETDDTTPLINPVGNSNNHGTFSQRISTASVNETRSTSSERNVASREGPSTASNNDRNENRTPLRVNPFDRVPNLPPNMVNLINDSGNESYTSAVRNFIRRIFNQSTLEDTSDNIVSPRQNVSVAVDMPSHPASNNILNANLSGSFKDDDNEQYETGSSYQSTRSASSNQVSSQGRLGVAAIPNTNFNPSPPMDRRSNRNRDHFLV